MFEPRCPGVDRTATPAPEYFKCAQCGGEIEIFSDETKRKCPQCGRLYEKAAETGSGKEFCDVTQKCDDPVVLTAVRDLKEKEKA